MAMSQAQIQTKLRSGIIPIGFTMYTNYLASSQVTFTFNTLEYPFLTEKLSGLEKYPLISTNVKYIPSRMVNLPQHERVQIFFSAPLLIKFVSGLPIEDDARKYDVLKHNIQFMLEMLFIIRYPFTKKINLASDADHSLSFFEAIKTETMIQQNNTYLNLEGKICTVTDVVLLDTIDTNPVYVKLYDLITDYKTKQGIALTLLTTDLNARLTEFGKEIGKYETEIVKKITKELDKSYGTTAANAALLNKLKNDIDRREKVIAEINKKLDDYDSMITARTNLLLFKKPANNRAIGLVSKAVDDIMKLVTTASISIPDLKSLDLKNAKNAKIIIDKLPGTDPKIQNGINTLVAYLIELTKLKMENSDAEKIILRDLEDDKTKLENENDTDKAELKKIEDNKNVKPTDIGGTGSDFTETIVTNALADPTNTGVLLSLKNNSINGLIADYKLMDDLNKLLGNIRGYLSGSKFEQIKDSIKDVYDSHKSFFQQSSQLTKEFMRLRKMSGFAFLMTKLYHYQDNQAIEYEYGINTNADPDLSRGEYSFRTSVIDALRAYYNPNRQPVEDDIYKVINYEDPTTKRKEIQMDRFIDMFEDSKDRKTIKNATVDLVTMQNRKVYECHVRINVVGGILTKENSDLVKCSYENMSIAADGIKTYYDLTNSEFIDLTNQIKEAEKENGIKYDKTAVNKSAIGPALAPGPGPGPALGPALGPGPAPGPAPALGARPAAPAVKKISDNELETIINKNRNKSQTTTFIGPPIIDRDLVTVVNNTEYSVVKDFLDTVYEYQRQMPTKTLPINPSSSITYGEDYENKKNVANSKIDLNINQKNTMLKRPGLSNDDKNAALKEKAMLEELKTVVENIDKQMWPETKGGKKTRKLRKHKRKLRKPRKSRKHRL